jgi:hypothetical protein
MSLTPFGRCPICAEELKLNEELLECPSGDYKANAKKFSDRWERFYSDIEVFGRLIGAVDESEELLADLQRMNIRSQA